NRGVDGRCRVGCGGAEAHGNGEECVTAVYGICCARRWGVGCAWRWVAVVHGDGLWLVTRDYAVGVWSGAAVKGRFGRTRQ
ncbi:hypothetical protein AMTR_s00076p00015310, partial [Amborella trichopoda]